MSQVLTFCCPLCKRELIDAPSEYVCRHCQKEFPIVFGIPDFRIFPDPYISFENDYKKGAVLKEHFDKADLAGLLDVYYGMTPEVPDDLRQRYIRYIMMAPDRGKALLEKVESNIKTEDGRPINTVLEIGCGTGGLLAAAGRRFRTVIGIDIAFRWLIVAQKRLDELHLDMPLICCCAEYLPFADHTFDLVVASDLLEHAKDQEKVIDESRRALKPNGVFFLVTQNRYTILPEPCVRVWGVGFLPRKWMAGYVRLIRGFTTYGNVRLLSYFELKKMLKARFERVRIMLPSFSPEEIKQLSSREKRQVAFYGYLRKIPRLRSIFYLIGPLFHILCYKEEKTSLFGPSSK